MIDQWNLFFKDSVFWWQRMKNNCLIYCNLRLSLSLQDNIPVVCLCKGISSKWGMDRRWKKNKSSGNNGDWNRSNSFMNKPEDGWLHHDDQLFSDAGVCYGVRVSFFLFFEGYWIKCKKKVDGTDFSNALFIFFFFLPGNFHVFFSFILLVPCLFILFLFVFVFVFTFFFTLCNHFLHFFSSSSLFSFFLFFRVDLLFSLFTLLFSLL